LRVALPGWLSLTLIGLALGGALGLAVVTVSPVYVVGGLIGMVAVLVVFSDVRYGLIGLIGVVTLLPFVVVPVSIGVVKLTLVDVCVSSILLIWLLRLLGDRSFSFKSTGIDLQVVLFIGVCLTSFVLGTSYMETSADARLFVKMLMGVVLVFAVVACVADLKTLRALVTCLAAGGSIAGGIAIALYFLPAATATRLLASLARFGYPETGILQYDANTKLLKAIGTSIDHNILGATLMMCGAIAVGLIVAPETGRRRLWLVVGLGVICVALLLTYSRGSLFGFLVGCAVIATLRYRKLWLVAGILLVAVALIPQLAQSSFLTHVQTGLAIQDKATAMRFGEYKDAFRLILAYPIFGVGFGSAPDVDLYVGVSSIYLLLAENVGLVGAAIWLWAIGAVVLRAFRQTADFHRPATTDPGRSLQDGPVPTSQPTEASTLAVACLGALVAALVAGLFDHHFVDIHFPHVVALFWLIVGLIVVGLRLDARQVVVQASS
jgi:hypothetical protein